MKWLLPALLGCFALSVNAATYYVDFSTGSDAANGTSTGTPWKHCPGDTNATSNANSTTPAAGDTVYFKGGVTYRGKITLKGGGNSGSQVVYSGTPPSWGAGMGIIDGTISPTWTQCTGNGTGAGQVPNANFASIYYTTLPAKQDWTVPVIESGRWLTIAQPSGNPIPFFTKDTVHWITSVGGVTRTSVTDTVTFTQADSAYWVGAKVLVRTTAGNNMAVATVTSYTPASHKVSFADIGEAVASDSYNIVCSPRQLSAAGQYAINEASGIVYCWPSNNIANVTVGSEEFAIDHNNSSYVTIDGLIIQGQSGTNFLQARAIGGTGSSTVNGLIIQNCYIKNIESTSATGATYLRGGGTRESGVTNCTFSYIHGRGPHITGDLIAVRNCYIAYIDGTCIYSQNYSTDQNKNGVISGNTIDFCRGVHQNGITVYGGFYVTNSAVNWVINNNIVRGFSQPYGNGAFTMQGCQNLLIYNNLFEADGGIPMDGVVNGSAYLRVYNNTVVPAVYEHIDNSIQGTVRIFNLTNSVINDFKNNICNGLIVSEADSGVPVTATTWSKISHSNNVYTALSASQTSAKGWSLWVTEKTNTAAILFKNPTGDDFSLSPTSPAIASGANLSGYFTTDITGKSRSAWDIGAYENDPYVANGPIIIGGSAVMTGTVTLSITPGSGVVTVPGRATWIRTIPAGFNVLPACVTADPLNNVSVAGGFSTSVNMGGGSIPSAGALDIFHASYSSANSFAWGKTYGTNSDDRAFSVASDSSGNWFVTGLFKKNVQFGGILLTNAEQALGTSDIFVYKCSPLGTVLWAKGFGSTSDDVGNSVAVDSSGNVILAASFVGTVNFGGTILTSTSGSSDYAFVKLSGANGSTTWAVAHGGSSFDSSSSVALDSSGNPVFVGRAGGAVDMGGGSIGTGGTVIAKYAAASGAYTWAMAITATSGFGTVEQSSGKVFLTGGFTGSVNFGGGSHTTPIGGNGGVYIAAYDSSGNWIWDKVYGRSGDVGNGIAVDTTGLLGIVGTAGGLMDFTGTGLYVGGNGFLCLSLTTDGAYRWNNRDTTANSTGAGVGFDSAGHMLATGGFQGSISMGGLVGTGVAGLTYGYVTQYEK